MYAVTLVLAFSIIIPSTLTASTVFENSDSERLRYFEFADDGQQQQQQQQPLPDYGGDSLFRQVIVVPRKSRKSLKAFKEIKILQ